MRKIIVVLAAVGLVIGFAPAANAAKAPFNVSLNISTTRIEVGQTITLSGSVSSKAKGKKVYIQRQLPGTGWKTVFSPKLSKKSVYSVTFKPGPGPTNYRVLKPASKKRANGTSPTRTVNAWRWINLTTLPTIVNANAVQAVPSSIIRVAPFGGSLLMPDNSAIGWNLQTRRCTTFRGYFGVDPLSDSSISTDVQIGVVLDAAGSSPLVLANVVNLGRGADSRFVYRDIPPTYAAPYLVITNDVDPGTGPGKALVAEPSVYCNS